MCVYVCTLYKCMGASTLFSENHSEPFELNNNTKKFNILDTLPFFLPLMHCFLSHTLPQLTRSLAPSHSLCRTFSAFIAESYAIYFVWPHIRLKIRNKPKPCNASSQFRWHPHETDHICLAKEHSE